VALSRFAVFREPKRRSGVRCGERAGIRYNLQYGLLPFGPVDANGSKRDCTILADRPPMASQRKKKRATSGAARFPE
jgi:hypothetical protein